MHDILYCPSPGAPPVYPPGDATLSETGAEERAPRTGDSSGSQEQDSLPQKDTAALGAREDTQGRSVLSDLVWSSDFDPRRRYLPARCRAHLFRTGSREADDQLWWVDGAQVRFLRLASGYRHGAAAEARGAAGPAVGLRRPSRVAPHTP